MLRSIGNGIKNGAGEFSKWGTAEDTVVWLVRMPRICAAILVGAALAAAGACFMMLMNQSSAMIQAGAFVTGIIAVTLSYFLSKAIGRGSNMILLLVLCGMTVNTLFQAVVSIIKYLADTESQLPEMTYWLMGSTAKVSYRDFLFFLIPFAVGIVPIIALRWKLNVLSFGEDEAKAMGVNVGTVRVVCIICATLLTAAVVSVAGTIGWVGLQNA